MLQHTYFHPLSFTKKCLIFICRINAKRLLVNEVEALAVRHKKREKSEKQIQSLLRQNSEVPKKDKHYKADEKSQELFL